MNISVSRPLPFLGVHQMHGSKWWLTLNDAYFYITVDGVEYEIFVPAGYRYDRSTIPWEGIISKDMLGCLGCLIHDVFYAKNGVLPTKYEMPTDQRAPRTPYAHPWKKFSRKEADEIFRVVMLEDKVTPWHANVAWFAVRYAARRW